MKKILAMALIVVGIVALMASCQEKEQESLVDNVSVSTGDRKVSFRGATVNVTFDAPSAWTARLEFKDGEGGWAEIRSNTLSGEAKRGAQVRISFEENKTAEERSLELWLTLADGGDECLCTLVQTVSDDVADLGISKALNTFMHDILKEDYLFADAYNQLEVNLEMSYKDFLPSHLLQLGTVNEADGGYYKSHSELAGERFIYTNIAEIQVGTKSIQTNGFGFGPFISTALAEGSTDMGIAPAYVRRGSPAEAAGLRRGDLIYGVNGMKLTSEKGNYRDYMDVLYQGTSGTYKFNFMRLEAGSDGSYGWNHYESKAVSAGLYIYDPVLHASILTDPDDVSVKIGYLVYESFDMDSQEFLEDAVDQFIAAGITDMILDLRFNAGGAVAQSRWLSGCIAGESNWKNTFTKVIYNDGSDEIWTFGHGYSNDVDNLGTPKDLGLDRLYVITSYNTASAAELVINSLRGVDFPVYLIGTETEGKNVGMTVSQIDQDGRRFHFAPVTFWVRNAKDFGNYPDGMSPDEVITPVYDNAFPYSFSDWGVMDINIALQWAYCEITGKDRWSSPLTRSVSVEYPLPVEMQDMELSHGRYGSLIYDADID